MSARIVLEGLPEFKRALHNLPEHLVDESSAIVISHAEEAARQVVAVYPEGPTGRLKGGVSVVSSRSRLTAQARVISRARHAHLYEFGTRQRRTDAGANRGRMPAAPSGRAAIPIFIRARRRMVQALIGVIQQAGMTVTPGA